MRTSLYRAAVFMLALGACRSAEVETGPEPGAQPAPPTADAVPAGTLLRVELNQALSTDRTRVGERFTATVRQPLVAANGQVVVPAGATVTGVVTGLDDSDHLGDQAAIRVNFERLQFRNRTYPLAAEVVDADVELESRKRRTAEQAAIGAAAGAALGAIIGGDLEGVLLGGALGAGAGTVISLGVGDVEAELPAGTEMTLRTMNEIRLR